MSDKIISYFFIWSYSVLAIPFIGWIFFPDDIDTFINITMIIAATIGLGRLLYFLRELIKAAKEDFKYSWKRKIFKSAKNRRKILYGIVYILILLFIFRPVINWIDSATSHRGDWRLGFSENILWFLFRVINLAIVTGLYKFFEDREEEKENNKKKIKADIDIKNEYYTKKVHIVESIGKAIALSEKGKFIDSNKIYNTLLKNKKDTISNEYIEAIITNKWWNFIGLWLDQLAKANFKLALKMNPNNNIAQEWLDIIE